MINKDCGILVAGLGKYPFGLAKEARFCQLKVVNGDAFPWLGGKDDCLLLHSSLLQGTLVMAPNRQPADLGAWTTANLLGISPWRASCWSFCSAICPRQ